MKFQENVFLKSYSNYKIGGPAKYFVEVGFVEELREVLRLAKSLSQDKIAILGGGTNVLISDEGFDGLVIYNKIEGIEEEGDNLVVGSGVLVKDLLNYCIENLLSGLEWAGGLPGTVGGAVRGNAGAFKGETKDNVVRVQSLNLKTLDEIVRENRECKFGYRNSIFKSGDGIYEFITHVVLGLAAGDKEEIEGKIRQKIEYRRNRHPLNYPNIGSIFKNIPLVSLSHRLQKELSAFVKTDPFPVVSASKLIVLCDLKGKRIGDAMISEKQPNFIVNVGNAKTEDVKALIRMIKQAVKNKYDILLEEEIIYLN